MMVGAIFASCGPKRLGCGPRRCETDVKKIEYKPDKIIQNAGKMT